LDTINTTPTMPMTETRQKLDSHHSPTRLTTLARLMIADADMSPLLKEISLCLEDPDEGVRQLAAAVLPKAGPGAVGRLIMALDTRQPLSVRQAAVTALGGFGPDAQSAVAPLIACLADEDSVLRANAVLALSRIGAPAVEGLTASLASEDERVRLGAIEALGWIGPDARPSVGTLKAIFTQLPLETLMASHAAVVKITGLAAEGVSMLVARLDHPDARIRRICLELLAELREIAAEAVGPILTCLKDPVEEVRAAAALALACIKVHGTEAVEALTQLLEDPHPPARTHAAIALSTMGASAQPALTRLQQLQADPDESVAATATAAIQHIKKQPKKKADC